MRINNRFCGHYFGRPLLEDSSVYTSFKEMAKDYVQAIEDYQTYNLHTPPTVEIGAEEYWATIVYCDTLEEVDAFIEKVFDTVAIELVWKNGTDIYFFVNTEELENAILDTILGEE